MVISATEETPLGKRQGEGGGHALINRPLGEGEVEGRPERP